MLTKNKTTELLKEIEAINGKSMIFQDTYDKRNNLKSELKGRLDALKEEEKFIFRLIEIEDKHDTDIHLPHLVDLELASIQEEIKLIEGAI